jgi:hypothetical protein
VVKGAVEAFNARDLTLLKKYFHEDMTIRRPLADTGSSLPNFPGSYHGLDEYLQVVSEVDQTVENLQVSPRKIEAGAGGMALVELLQSFGPDEGREHQITWVVDQIADGKIAWTANFASEDEARRAFERGQQAQAGD